MRRHH
jgi:hypothetical protein